MPTATVHLDALDHNLERLRGYLRPEVQVLAAVKANAYGHGLVEVANRLKGAGVRWFGVATAGEAVALRHAGLTENILIFGPVYEALERLIDHGVALTAVDGDSLEKISQVAKRAGAKARVHLKVDTGMGRLGRPAKEALALAQAADREKNILLEGLWTHFACADEEDTRATVRQLERYEGLLDNLQRHGIGIPLKHAANSAGIIAFPDSHYDMVRPGIALYGYHSSAAIARLEAGLKPVMTLTAPVTFVKRVEAGTPISYSALWRAPRDTTVATVRIGYADGYPRALSNRAQVLVKGRLCPVAGRVCMDQLMVDVGDMDVQPGDRVTLFGGGGPSAEDLGGLAGTISYEILTSVGARVKRVYTP